MVHHIKFKLKHKQAAGTVAVVVGVIACAADVKETFCPTV